MRNPGIFLFMLGATVICSGQTAQESKVPSRCILRVWKRKPFPKGRFSFLPNESYKRSPIVKFQINEDGTVSNTKVTRRSPFRRGRYRQRGCRRDCRLEVCAKGGMSCHRVRDVRDDRLGMTSSTCVKGFPIVLLASGKCSGNTRKNRNG